MWQPSPAKQQQREPASHHSEVACHAIPRASRAAKAARWSPIGIRTRRGFAFRGPRSEAFKGGRDAGQAELMLAAQLSISVAADQRAFSFTNLLAVGATIITGAGASLLLSQNSFPTLAAVCFASAVGLLAAMFLANMSARPETFYVAGNSPEDWLPDIESGVSLEDCRIEILEDFADRIRKNNLVLKRNGDLFQNAFWIAWLSLLGGALMAIVLLTARFG